MPASLWSYNTKHSLKEELVWLTRLHGWWERWVTEANLSRRATLFLPFPFSSFRLLLILIRYSPKIEHTPSNYWLHYCWYYRFFFPLLLEGSFAIILFNEDEEVGVGQAACIFPPESVIILFLSQRKEKRTCEIHDKVRNSQWKWKSHFASYGYGTKEAASALINSKAAYLSFREQDFLQWLSESSMQSGCR